MTKIKTGLGRGLDALINPQSKEEIDKPFTISSNNLKSDDGESIDIIAKIPINLIKPNPFQPRKDFDSDALEELKKSILENGLIQPITIRRSADKKYELISGERRLRACSDIGFEHIPSYIIKVDSKEAMVALALIENIQREKLNAIEVAEAYKRLIEECNLSQEEIAKRVGKDRSTVTNSLRLLKLPESIKQSLIKNEINAGHARALINLPSEKYQNELLKKIINEQLSVRKVENLVKSFLKLAELPKSKNKENGRDSREIISNNDVENKLRNIFGTKVLCKQKKDGTGEVIIEYYSNEELERLFELFEIIEKSSY
jgi:ParB family chromosome partitioning protein